MKWQYDYGTANVSYEINVDPKDHPYWLSEEEAKDIVEREHYHQLKEKFENEKDRRVYHL